METTCIASIFFMTLSIDQRFQLLFGNSFIIRRDPRPFKQNFRKKTPNANDFSDDVIRHRQKDVSKILKIGQYLVKLRRTKLCQFL